MRAPATSANLGSGFDVFGAALERPADVVTVERAPETTIAMTGAGSQYIPEDPDRNVAGAVAEALEVTARIEIDKGVRPSSGLGSSAASAAGVAVALDELYDLGYSRRELVPIAAEGEALASGEAHVDNVAPALLGGFTAAADGGARGSQGRTRNRGRGQGPSDLDVTQIDATVPLVVCLPDLVVSTRDARAMVPDSASMDDLVETVGHAAQLVVGMCRDDPSLVGAGMEDPVVTPARAGLIDGYDDVREAALAAGATGVTVSGAGPAVVAACYPEDRRSIAAGMVETFADAGIDARAYQTAVGEGATIHG